MDPSPAVLGQLLLLQSTLHAMVGQRQLAEYITAGLGCVPGVAGVGLCQSGRILAVAPASLPLNSCCQICQISQRQVAAPRLVNAFLVESETLRPIALRTTFNQYGHLLFVVADPAVYEIYAPFVESVANVVALSLESRTQAIEVRLAAEVLETRVQERTAELEEVHAKLREREHLIARIVATAPTAIFIFDLSTQSHVYANERMESMLGYSRIQIGQMGANLLPELMHPEDREHLADHQVRLLQLADGDVAEIEYRLRHVDGSYRTLHFWESVFSRDEAGHPERIVGVGLDVTEARDAEAKQEELQKQLVVSQRMEAVGRLAGGIAHDFNNLLTVINSYAEFGMSELQNDESARWNFEQILLAGQRAASLTKQLLAFGRKQVLQPKPVDLNQIVMSMETMLRRLIGEDIEFVLTLSDGLGLVSVDAAQIEQVVMNLVLNARDAMPRGGRLAVETRWVYLTESQSSMDAVRLCGDFVVLSVVDDGVGMETAIRQRIFEPFFTTKDAGRGTGLGLATSYGIVKQSGGDIRVVSVPRQGSTFEVYLPRVKTAGEEAAPVASRPRMRRGIGCETVLVVDDEDSIRNLTRQILVGSGYAVLLAKDGEEALHLAASYPGPIHLLLTDVVMPIMTGRSLAERLRRVRPDLKVVYMSGYTASIIIDHGVLEAGMNFVAKPFSPAELRQVVREILDLDQPRFVES